MSAEKHQGASLEGMFPKLTPEQEARLRPVTEKDVLLSPEEAAALSEEERVEMETMRWKQVPPELPKPPKPPQKPPQKRKKRRRKPPELRTLLLALIILVVAAMVCGAILLGHYTGGSPTGKQKDSGFSDRSDAAGGDDAWNYASEDKEKQETLPAYTGDRTGVTLTLNSTIGKKTLSYQELYQQCLPTTVSIAVENRDGSGSGSGVVLTQDGYIITCAHVIDDQASAEVTTNDGKTYPAQLVGSDAQTDLALLKIDATGLTPAQFGKTEELQVGEEALAIGDQWHPLRHQPRCDLERLLHDPPPDHCRPELRQFRRAADESLRSGHRHQQHEDGVHLHHRGGLGLCRAQQHSEGDHRKIGRRRRHQPSRAGHFLLRSGREGGEKDRPEGGIGGGKGERQIGLCRSGHPGG